MIAYLADEAYGRLNVFAEGGDIYCASASQMFHVPVVKHGIDGRTAAEGENRRIRARVWRRYKSID